MAYQAPEQHFDGSFQRQYHPNNYCSPAQRIQVQISRQRPSLGQQSHQIAYDQINPPLVNQRTLLPQGAYQQQSVHVPGNVLPPVSTVVSTNGYAIHPTPQSSNQTPPPLEYQMLLLAMAEDCFSVARGEGSVDLVWHELEWMRYYKYVATGLGYLEVVLKHWRLQPHLEAVTRLRYASVLHEETDNQMEAEEALTKGIALSERHRFSGLKYNMQHLLARVMYSTNTKASLKFLDGIIRDVEAYQHTAWVYAFRFLRVALSLQLSSRPETLVALSHLKIIATLANSCGDNAISTTAFTIEALIHLRESNSAESIEQSQRALAAARSSQLDRNAQTIPQLVAMMHFVDLCCSLQHFDGGQVTSKMLAMQASLDHTANDNSWTEDGVCVIPIRRDASTNLNCDEDNQGVLRTASNGSTIFLIHWLPREDMYTLGYLLSGAAVANRNAMDGQKSEQYLKEGIRTLQAILHRKSTIFEPLASVAARALWRRNLLCQMQLQLIFALCARTAWPVAKEQMDEVKETSSSLNDEMPESLSILVLYLEGIILQGTGDLTSALTIYRSPKMALPPSNDIRSISHVRRDISILCTLNSISIIRNANPPKSALLSSLLTTIEPLCLTNPSKNIQSAYYLARATAYPHDLTGVVKMKQYLQSALQAAKQVANNQLMCTTLNFMSWRFFRGVVAEQAEKSARASQSLAKKGRDTLWTSVADGQLSETLDMQGKGQEAEAIRREALELAGRLPVNMQRELEVDEKEQAYGK